MHYHDPEYVAAREKLTQAVKEYSNIVAPDGHLMLGATVVYETTKFDDDGWQVYNMDHVILDPSSLIHAVGLLETAKEQIKEYINRIEPED